MSYMVYVKKTFKDFLLNFADFYNVMIEDLR
jgi:hypothetical protein